MECYHQSSIVLRHPHASSHGTQEEELRAAKIPLERADINGHRIEQRFGHPALHAELFTPMLRANMMPLLKEVHVGRIGPEKPVPRGTLGCGVYLGIHTKPQTTRAQTPEGIRIDAVEQNDLEYDLIRYQRDRQDWDSQSMISTAILRGPNPSVYSRFQYPSTEAGMLYGTSRHSGYDRYLSSGPASPAAVATPIELLTDQRQLLATQNTQPPLPGYFDYQQHPRYDPAYTTPPSPSMNQSRFSPDGPPMPRPQVLSWVSVSDIGIPSGERQDLSYHEQSSPNQLQSLSQQRFPQSPQKPSWIHQQEQSGHQYSSQQQNVQHARHSSQ